MCVYIYVSVYVFWCVCMCIFMCVCVCVCVCILACFMVLSHVVRLTSHHSRLDYPMNRCVRDSGLL